MSDIVAGAGARLQGLGSRFQHALVVLGLAVLAACGASRQVDGVTTAEVACTSCHGDPNRAGSPLEKSAPPAAPHGGDGGAHRAHMAAGVGCATCHVMPSSPSHSDGVVDVKFSGTATAGNATPMYSGGTSGTCSGVYCHGATLNAGGQVPQPVWRDAPLACSSCHGYPPPSPHPAATTCHGCHADTVNVDETINVAGGRHANGVLDGGGHPAPYPADQHGPAANAGLNACRSCHGQTLDGGTAPSCTTCHATAGYPAWQSNCTFCHGTKQKAYTAASLAQAAPPRGAQGETATTTRAVGAHAAHLVAGGNLGPAVACTECHAVPADLAHVDGTATLTFGATARKMGAQPTFNGATCASVYCHGAALTGGTNTSPAWTGGSAEVACGSCHGVPPPPSHSTSIACEGCHEGYTSSTVNPALHMNGTIEANGHPAGWNAKDQHGYATNTRGIAGCASCHGADYDGGTSGVSCNACHTTAGFQTWQTNCTFCHGTRLATYTSANLDSAAPPVGTQGEILSSAVAVGAHEKHLAGGAIGPKVACATCHAVPTSLAHVTGTPVVALIGPAALSSVTASWNGAAATCTTYCHGASLRGGTNKAPSWTGGPSQAACGTCHGVPPTGNGHSTSTACGTCHSGYTATTVNATLHLNGKVDATSSHPAGWAAKTSHGYEVNRSGISGCTGCHGADYNGGNSGISCNTCHSNAGYGTWATNCTFCHGTRTTAYTNTPANLKSAAPPVGSLGETATSALAVGAHQKHLTGGTIGPAVDCATCHTVPTTLAHVTGTPDVTMIGTAALSSVSASWNATAGTCSTYCHGASLSGGSLAAPSWTAGSTQTQCGTCHGIPPTAGHTTSTSCGTCHSGYTATTVNRTLHLNGRIDATQYHTTANWAAKTVHGYEVNRSGIAGCTGCHGADYKGGTSGISCDACHQTAGYGTWATNCTFCHGTRTATYTNTPANLRSAAPPVGSLGETATTAMAVGAHQKHLSGGTIGPAVDCATCHSVPTTLAHVTGTPDVTMIGTAALSQVPPAWNATAGTCLTYCHGASLSGGSLAVPSWTAGSTQTQCGTCHGIPPTAGHTTSTSCGTCHSGYTATTINRSLHINGRIDATQYHTTANWATKTVHGYEVNRSGIAGCTGCHGADYKGGTSGISCDACHQTAGYGTWATNCTFCHGTRVASYSSANLTSAAPPVGTQGETATTTPAVGAHLKHLTGGGSVAVPCGSCHTVPTNLAHVTGTPVVNMTGIAAQGTTASYTSGTCNTYCHGVTLSGGSATKAPSWTGTNQAACGTCHGIPPGNGHSTSTTCGNCHTGYTSTSVNKTLHIDGKIDATSPHPAGWAASTSHGYRVNKVGLFVASGADACKSCHGANLTGGSAQSCSSTSCHASNWATNCTFCHGTGTNFAPPVDTQGLSDTTNTSVGLHATHLTSALMPAQACTACHPARSTSVITDTAHIDGNGVAEVVLPSKVTGGAAGTYTHVSATSGTCATAYCHGNFTGGTGGNIYKTATSSETPNWTSTTQVNCSSCHVLTNGWPRTGKHGTHNGQAQCAECHGVGYSSTTIVKATHVNGTKDLVGNVGYNRTSGSCSPGCHDPQNW